MFTPRKQPGKRCCGSITTSAPTRKTQEEKEKLRLSFVFLGVF